MAGRRKYDDGCGIAHALDLVGERWALLVVRELLLGPKRFTDLRAGLPSASPDMISQRLQELQAAGVVRRHQLPPPAASWVYELTEWGADLEPIVVALARWSSRSGLRRPAAIGVDSLALSFKALFDPAAASDLTATIALRLEDEWFELSIADRALEVRRGKPANADVTLTTTTAILGGVLAESSISSAVTDGALAVDGDPAVIDRLRRMFPRPTPARA